MRDEVRVIQRLKVSKITWITALHMRIMLWTAFLPEPTGWWGQQGQVSVPRDLCCCPLFRWLIQGLDAHPLASPEAGASEVQARVERMGCE